MCNKCKIYWYFDFELLQKLAQIKADSRERTDSRESSLLATRVFLVELPHPPPPPRTHTNIMDVDENPLDKFVWAF